MRLPNLGSNHHSAHSIQSGDLGQGTSPLCPQFSGCCARRKTLNVGCGRDRERDREREKEAITISVFWG